MPVGIRGDVTFTYKTGRSTDSYDYSTGTFTAKDVYVTIDPIPVEFSILENPDRNAEKYMPSVEELL